MNLARQEYEKVKSLFPSNFVRRNMDVVGTPGDTYFIHWVKGGALDHDLYMEKTCDNAWDAKAEAYYLLLNTLFHWCEDCGYMPVLKTNPIKECPHCGKVLTEQ